MVKHRPIAEILVDLEKAEATLKDVQERGDAALSAFDLSMGYDADFYLNKCPLLESHVEWYKNELNTAEVQPTLF